MYIFPNKNINIQLLLTSNLSQIYPVQILLMFIFKIHSSFLDAFAKVQKATITFVMSVCLSAWNNSVPTGRIFMKFDI
jgi:hypothetical protein